MATIGVDLGATKLSAAIFGEDGLILSRTGIKTEGQGGEELGRLILAQVRKLMLEAFQSGIEIEGIGLCVPGIYHQSSGTVWAPNIPGWDNYPLGKELCGAFSGLGLSIRIESDRTCYILGESWCGVAKGSSNAIYLSVGTGIGAGILCDGHIIRGAADIAGAVGWMALAGSYLGKYRDCGCFEYHASGSGLVKCAGEKISGKFKDAKEIIDAFNAGDPLAEELLDTAVKMWGMASANLISIFNPEILVFGGGIFGPAATLLPRIRQEASLWAQPVSMKQVRFAVTSLAGDAGLMGAGRLPLVERL
ncbi:MAG: ROK family protein [Bacteroidota bacterium]